MTVESTLASFAKGIETGVSTLELDLQITKDGHEVITHDRKISGQKCLDTAPVTPNDPQFPYVGKYVKDLTFAQVRSLDCGSLTLPQFPGQAASPGAKMPTLAEVFALADSHRASQVKFNIETKVEAGAPQETAPREQFVDVALREIKAAHMQSRVSIESFDWGSLRLVQQRDPQIRTVALTNKDFLQAGQPGKSPWLGGIDADDFGGDLVAAASSLGFDAISPGARHAAERRRDGSGGSVTAPSCGVPCTGEMASKPRDEAAATRSPPKSSASMPPSHGDLPGWPAWRKSLLVRATVRIWGSRCWTRRNEPQSKLSIETRLCMWAALISRSATSTNCSRGAVSCGAPPRPWFRC